VVQDAHLTHTSNPRSCPALAQASQGNTSLCHAGPSMKPNGERSSAPCSLHDRIVHAHDSDLHILQQKHPELMRDDQGLYWFQGRVYVPNHPVLCQHILHEQHDATWAVHRGVLRTFDLVSRQYWWPGLRMDVARYVRTCDACQRVKPTNEAAPGLRQSLPIPSRRWESVSFD
jgi:hypothetical protein